MNAYVALGINAASRTHHVITGIRIFSLDEISQADYERFENELKRWIEQQAKLGAAGGEDVLKMDQGTTNLTRSSEKLAGHSKGKPDHLKDVVEDDADFDEDYVRFENELKRWIEQRAKPQDSKPKPLTAKAMMATEAISSGFQPNKGSPITGQQIRELDIDGESQISGLDSRSAWNVDIEAQTIVSGLDSEPFYIPIVGGKSSKMLDITRNSPGTSTAPSIQSESTDAPALPDYNPTSLKICGYFRIWTVCI